MFGIKKKKGPDDGGFRSDDREAPGSAEAKRAETKKGSTFGGIGRRSKKRPAAARAGSKRLNRYYRGLLFTGLAASLTFFAASFGGSMALHSLGAPKQGGVPQASRALNSKYQDLKQRYEKFNFDSFKLLIESGGRPSPQTDEEKETWRKSLVRLFGDDYIRGLKETINTPAAPAGFTAESGVPQAPEAQAEKAVFPTYQVSGVSRSGEKTLITVIGAEGTEYWTFVNGASRDAPEGYAAKGLDLKGDNEFGLPGFILAVSGGTDSVFIPLTGVSAKKTTPAAAETKRRQSFASVRVPSGEEKMASLGTEKARNAPAAGAAKTGGEIDKAVANPDGSITVKRADGSVETIETPKELSPGAAGAETETGANQTVAATAEAASPGDPQEAGTHRQRKRERKTGRHIRVPNEPQEDGGRR